MDNLAIGVSFEVCGLGIQLGVSWQLDVLCLFGMLVHMDVCGIGV